MFAMGTTRPMPAPAPPTAPRPEGHRAWAWLGFASVSGLGLGLMLLALSSGSETSERTFARTPAASLGRSMADRATPIEAGWFDLQLPEGGLRRVRSEAALPDLLALKDALDRAAIDARLDLDHQAIHEERAGRQLDVDASLAAIEQARANGLTQGPLVFISLPPRRRASELTAIASDVVLGAFETPCDRGCRGREREHELQQLAAALDGSVVLPGEVFSFNRVVGPRDDSHGYRVAAAAALGANVDGVGSSASQSASTLHAAAIFAGLELLERHPLPGPRPVIELGLEAAVAFAALDLRLRNPYDFPVVLREVVSAGKLRAEVRGRQRPYVISLVRSVERATPFEQIEREDALVPLGERVLAQRGVPGLELRWHHVRRAGSHSVRHTTLERYPATPQIVLVGTGQPPTTTGRPQRELAPEYLPNELLAMTQSDAPDGTLVVQRVPGRFGTPGWAKNVGAPAWISPPDSAADNASASESGEFFRR